MLIDHENARAHVKAALEGLTEKDTEKVVRHLRSYIELLTEHIKKEDEILYVWMDRNLTVTQVGELFSKFNRADAKFKDAPRRYEELINKLEAKITKS